MSLAPEVWARLRLRFIERLPGRLESLQSVRARLDTGDSEASAEARSVGHQLAGTAASFGLPELSELGRTLEHCAPDEFSSELDRLIEALLATLQREEDAKSQ